MEELAKELNKPMTNSYKLGFWQKKYHNENLLNPNKKKSFLDDPEFLKKWGIKVIKW